jgi:divalent metal cation (Fe/Co/Zn/Cd) transporter
MTPIAELPVARVAPSSLASPNDALERERERLIGRGKALSWLSLGWMGVEGAVAITAALIAGSVALLGFGIDSAIEGLASVIVIWRFTGSRRGSEHAEDRAQKLVAISSSCWPPYVAQDAIRTLISGARPSTSWVGMGLSVSSIVIMPLLGAAKQRIGERLGSGATVGEGAQNRLCGCMGAGVLVGLLANAVLGARWVDPVIALGIAALAAWEGGETWRGQGCCALSPSAAGGGPACCDDPGCAE